MIRNLLERLGFGPRGSRGGQPETPIAGDLWSVVTDDGLYGVAKILAVDGAGVHARLYVQRFQTRPAPEEIGELTLAPFGAGHDVPFSIGHMPLSRATYAEWQPELIARGSVDEDELEGFRMWEEARGGYF